MIEKDDPQITGLLKHQIPKALSSVPKEAKKYLLQAGTQEEIQDTQPMTATQKVKMLKDRYKIAYKKLMRERWYHKQMHGKFPTLLEKEYIDTEEVFHWMKFSELKGETEGLVTAVQDHALNTR